MDQYPEYKAPEFTKPKAPIIRIEMRCSISPVFFR